MKSNDLQGHFECYIYWVNWDHTAPQAYFSLPLSLQVYRAIALLLDRVTPAGSSRRKRISAIHVSALFDSSPSALHYSNSREWVTVRLHFRATDILLNSGNWVNVSNKMIYTAIYATILLIIFMPLKLFCVFWGQRYRGHHRTNTCQVIEVSNATKAFSCPTFLNQGDHLKQLLGRAVRSTTQDDKLMNERCKLDQFVENWDQLVVFWNAWYTYSQVYVYFALKINPDVK